MSTCISDILCIVNNAGNNQSYMHVPCGGNWLVTVNDAHCHSKYTHKTLHFHNNLQTLYQSDHIKTRCRPNGT